MPNTKPEELAKTDELDVKAPEESQVIAEEQVLAEGQVNAEGQSDIDAQVDAVGQADAETSADPSLASSPSKPSKRRMPFLAKLIIGVVVVVVALIALSALRQNLEEKSDAYLAEDNTWAEMVSLDDPALQQVLEHYPNEELCLACAADITDDGLTDLIVITRDDEKAYTTPLIADSENSWHELERTLAPYQNQRIRFFDMDKDGVNETLITGDRDGRVGYAVYRITSDGEFVDIFGENMEDCC